MEESPQEKPLLDIVTRQSRVMRPRNGKRVRVGDLKDGPNRLRLGVMWDAREPGLSSNLDHTYVIDCRNRAAVEHVMKEIRRLMGELDGLVLPPG